MCVPDYALRSTLNPNVFIGLGMCEVCTEAVHYVALLTLGPRTLNIGTGISNLGSRISNLGSRISDLESRISDLESRISNLGSRISNLGSRISDLESRISNLGSRISNLGSRISNLIVKCVLNSFAETLRSLKRSSFTPLDNIPRKWPKGRQDKK